MPKTSTTIKLTGSTSVVLGPEDSRRIAEGDCEIRYGVFPARDDFQALRDEVRWQRMSHAGGEVPRLVCCQGLPDPLDGSTPVYRHPADRSLPVEPFTPCVDRVRRAVEGIVGHAMNHCLVQLYRSGDDHITEHSDKTLDITRGSRIVNASFGAQRVMRLRTKRLAAPAAKGATGGGTSGGTAGGRVTQLVPLPHGSVFVLGAASNARWLHGVRYDRRPAAERSEAEVAFGGERISLTFRSIGTFLDAEGDRIWGQGAVAKTRGAARPVVNGNEAESRRIIDAFGFENQASEFDWEAMYGAGFDVLHLHPAVD